MNNNPITKSEWQIMRILWEKEYSTSSEITDALASSKEWSPTTVKTFLARLVKKEAISYEVEGRVYKYYPLVTEMECVKQVMGGLIQQVYGGALNYQTDNFRFYGDNDKDYIKLLANSLEENYERISSDLVSSRHLNRQTP